MVKVEEFLIYLDQDPVVSEKTEQYVLWYMPALFIYMINDLNRKFLNSFRMTMVPFLSFTISVAFHPVWVKIFVIEYGLGLQGIALAGTITNLITFTVIKVFIRNQPSLAETRVPFFDKSTFDRAGLRQYMKLALPLIATTFLAIWYLEQMTLAAGLISMED